MQPAHGVDDHRHAPRRHARIAQVDRDRLVMDAGLLEELRFPWGAVEVDRPVGDEYAPRVGAACVIEGRGSASIIARRCSSGLPRRSAGG